MKLMKITTFFMLLAAFLFTSPATAMIESNTATATTIDKQKNELKKEFKMQKRLSKFEKFFKKAGIDLQDPVNKWLWFAIFGWGAAVVLWIISAAVVTTTLTGFGIWALLGTLCSLFGTVAFVIWLVKKFS
jgi:Flp pilus assembly protein TadB